MPEALHTQETADRMRDLAVRFLASLSPAQREKAAVPFDDETERRIFHYTPIERRGLPLIEMTHFQEQFALEFIASGLSRTGYYTVTTLLGLENALSEQDDWRDRPYAGRDGPGRFRDPQLYFVTVFGDPEGARPWAWRFGGHHISIHYCIVDGSMVRPTPTFLGSHPAFLDLGGGNVLRPLAPVEDVARELVRSLSASQATAAVISPVAPPDIVLSNRPFVEEGATPYPLWRLMEESPSGPRRERWERFLEQLGYRAEHEEAARYTSKPKGLAAERLTAAQRDLMRRLLRLYAERLPEPLAASESRKFEGRALEAVHFAWAGSYEPGEPHYYRLQGPRLLVEYDNTQNDVNHIHSIWRDPEGDFGADLLARHYAEAHAD